MGSRPERVNGHKGTETRPLLLREAAVGNIGQWANEPDPAILCERRRLSGRKVLSAGKKEMTVPA